MKSKVWFAGVNEDEDIGSVAEKVVLLADRAGLKDVVRAGGLTAILQHVGEGSNTGHIKPEVTGKLAARIAALKGKPFLTGSSTLYIGGRSNAVDHLRQACAHRFTPEVIGCPIVMCDGLRGADQLSVKVPNAKRCPTAYLGSGVGVMDSLVAVTHPTGHVLAGFGAAIKNISMGLSSRGGKLAMHHNSHPIFTPDKCIGCGRCAQWCPAEAILVEKKARLLKEKCIGCGECFAVCPVDAIDFEWGEEGQKFQEMMVEYCVAVKSRLGDRILYINVITHFQEGCDCFDTVQPAMCKDVGIAVSRDIVAVDAATADLLADKSGKDIVREAAGRDYRGMLDCAARMGLGTSEYQIEKI